MTTRARAALLGGSVVASVVFGVASLAWACTNFARVDAINPPADAARSEVTVRGVVGGANTPVELRWNALNGPVVGAANADASGQFSVKGTVPQAEPGIYSIIAVAGEAGVGRVAFEVTAPAGAPPAVSPVGLNGADGPSRGLWSGYDAGSSSLDSPASSPDLAIQLGLGLLGVGLAGTLAGVAVATTRRRARVLSGRHLGD